MRAWEGGDGSHVALPLVLERLVGIIWGWSKGDNARGSTGGVTCWECHAGQAGGTLCAK